ncbi:MAG: hypothetical protein IJU30_03825, partial [Lachnospiraceae bacterium]|nr:hypothetical protein [Lachnospiraceae bacterium]
MKIQSLFFAVILTAVGMLSLSACGSFFGMKPSVDQPGVQGTGASTGTTAAGTSAVKGDSPEGIWYEQAPMGGRLEIGKDKIKYISGHSDYTDESELKIVKNGSEVLLETAEEWFAYIDMSYDRETDTVYGHTMPHTDGDGGYHLIEFRRTEYVPPAAPVYDPPVDNSDPDAQKEFADTTIRAMKVFFYDEGIYHSPDSSMAPEPPYADEYSYDLTVQDDGTALVSSSFCQEIELPKRTVEKLQALIDETDLCAINGVDIHTEGLPYGTANYELELELASGETIRSSANGYNVPANWTSFQEPMHHLLFYAFVDAGYNYSGGAFHSTKPMKRIGTGSAPEPFRPWSQMYSSDTDGDGEALDVNGNPLNANEPEPLGITRDSVSVEPDWKKAYDYDLHTSYMTFKAEDGKHPALIKTLEEISDYYKKASEASLKEDYEMMEAVPKSVWSKADRRYSYSFYSAEYDRNLGSIYFFFVSEGHANSLGVGKYGHGYYPQMRYNIDVETGKILSAGDLFVSEEEACRVITEAMREKYGNYSEVGKYIQSDEFPEKLKNYVNLPAPQGISFYAKYDGVELYFPAELFPMADYQVTETL